MKPSGRGRALGLWHDSGAGGGPAAAGLLSEHRALKIALGKDPEGTLKQLAALAEAKRVVVLASGDPVRTL